MDDAARTEDLAKQGLRILLAVYAHHPDQAFLGADQVGLTSGFSRDQFPDHDRFDHLSETPVSEFVPALMLRMIEDGVLRGKMMSGKLAYGSVPPTVRAALRSPAGGGMSEIAVIREALAADIRGESGDTGTFTMLARRIGFEP